jgi:hypothetical protein
VLSSGHPYSRVHKLWRRCASLWWRRFESSGVVCHLFMWKGRGPLAQTREVLESSIQEPSRWRACDAHCCALSGGAPHNVAPLEAGDLVHRLVPGKSPSRVRCLVPQPSYCRRSQSCPGCWAVTGGPWYPGIRARHQPPLFAETTDLLDANHYIHVIKLKYGLLHYSEFQKTLYGAQ